MSYHGSELAIKVARVDLKQYYWMNDDNTVIITPEGYLRAPDINISNVGWTNLDPWSKTSVCALHITMTTAGAQGLMKSWNNAIVSNYNVKRAYHEITWHYLINIAGFCFFRSVAAIRFRIKQSRHKSLSIFILNLQSSSPSAGHPVILHQERDSIFQLLAGYF